MKHPQSIETAQGGPVASNDVLGELPVEVWIVFNSEGPDFVSTFRQGAMDHAAGNAGMFPEFGPWRVCKYIQHMTPNA